MAVNPVSPYRNSDTAPFFYFDVVPTYGTMNGAIQVELAARMLSPEGAGVAIELVPIGRLRCSPAAAQHLVNALTGALN